MSGNSIRDTFFEECEELLEALVEGLAQLEESPDDDEIVNAVFRAVHSIKGGAGAFGLDRLVHFAHTFETVMDMVRDKKLQIDSKLIGIFHRSGDQLSDLVSSERDGTDVNETSEATLLEALGSYLGDADEEEDFSFDALVLDIDGEDKSNVAFKYEIEFTPSKGLYDNGHEPLLLFDALAEHGALTVKADVSRIPNFDAFDPIESYLSWTLTLSSHEPEAVVLEVFEFVEGLAKIDIKVEETDAGAVPAVDVGDVPVPETTLDSLLNEAPPPVPEPSPAAKAKPASKESRGPKPTLRVDLDRVDRLINTVGELIINQAMVSQRIEELDLPTVAHLTNELEAYKLLARDIQEGVMAIRAQPVKPLFQRMSRIVREASDATGKKAKLVTIGDSTEVDKTVIERLADPLTHMIRNAVDHGIESVTDRTVAGKDATGTIRLSAAHRSGSVFIEITDDGAGLNREKILSKAIEKNLISPDADLSEPEIDNLLFLPGFSTAGQVSNLSGRGVGMDVVKNAVQDLGGRVSISSNPGKGTTFTIILPLTLAVMDGFVISVGRETMVIPISSILETVRPRREDMHTLGTNSKVVNVRGSYVPIVDVAAMLGIDAKDDKSQTGILLLISTETIGLIALRVASIYDQRQVVIKSLESNYTAIPGVSAATILGDGKIALILDPDELIRLAQTGGGLDPNPQPNKAELRHA